jgi:hypothetical protein
LLIPKVEIDPIQLMVVVDTVHPGSFTAGGPGTADGQQQCE